MRNDETRRKQLIRLIHVGRRELAMQDADYRAMLAGIPALGGKTSSADIGVKGLELVLKALQAKGFKIRAKAGTAKTISRKLADDAQSRLIRHLWLELHTAGKVKDPSEKAMAAYVCRIVKIEALQWLDSDQASRVIETLKKWLGRK